MKVAVYAIAKNESRNVAEWLENLKDADGIFVLDTGSQDNTIEQLEAGGAVVNRMGNHKPFRFDHARNESLSYVPDDFDVCISLDFDERLNPEWRQEIEASFDDLDAANYTLVYSFNEDGDILQSYPRMAVHKKGAGIWRYAAHEIFLPHDGAKIGNVPCFAVHYGDPKKAGHYLDLLKIAHAEEPKNPRTIAYLAREYFAVENHSMAYNLYQEVLSVEDYPPARSEACLQLARLSSEFETAEWWYRQAVQECNNMREPYCELAVFYFRNQQYEHAIAYVKSAWIIEKPTYETIYRDEYYSGLWMHHMLMACYQQLDSIRLALHHMHEAINVCGGKIPQTLVNDIVTLQRVAQDKFHAYSDSFGHPRPPREVVGETTE